MSLKIEDYENDHKAKYEQAVKDDPNSASRYTASVHVETVTASELKRISKDGTIAAAKPDGVERPDLGTQPGDKAAEDPGKEVVIYEHALNRATIRRLFSTPADILAWFVNPIGDLDGTVIGYEVRDSFRHADQGSQYKSRKLDRRDLEHWFEEASVSSVALDRFRKDARGEDIKRQETAQKLGIPLVPEKKTEPASTGYSVPAPPKLPEGTVDVGQ